jgi:hypothetical protein
MRCDEIRELLPEALLGSLDEVTDAAVRRHLRGCAACREEQTHLEEGIAALSRAAHDQVPPGELRERVLEVLAEEWRGEAAPPTEERPARAAAAGLGRSRVWLASAAAIVLLVASFGWGLTQHRRAAIAAADAASYRAILSTLGGRDFRLGELHASGEWEGLQGQVVLYDGDTGWTSWGLVFAQDPGRTGELTATLLAADGRTLVLPPLRFSGGEASVWLATHDDLTAFDRMTLTDADGTVLATVEIHGA